MKLESCEILYRGRLDRLPRKLYKLNKMSWFVRIESRLRWLG